MRPRDVAFCRRIFSRQWKGCHELNSIISYSRKFSTRSFPKLPFWALTTIASLSVRNRICFRYGVFCSQPHFSPDPNTVRLSSRARYRQVYVLSFYYTETTTWYIIKVQRVACLWNCFISYHFLRFGRDSCWLTGRPQSISVACPFFVPKTHLLPSIVYGFHYTHPRTTEITYVKIHSTPRGEQT